MDEGKLPAQRTTLLQSRAHSSLDVSISTEAQKRRALPDSDSGYRAEPPEVWLQTDLDASTQAGAPDRKEKSASDLPRRRLTSAHEAEKENGFTPEDFFA
jgi:hypothetical protein